MDALIHINRINYTKTLFISFFIRVLSMVFAVSAPAMSTPAAEMGLTDAEKEWPRAHPRIRMGVDPAFAPYSFRDDKGRYQGVAMEFTRYLADQLGIAMEAAPNLGWTDIVAGVRERELDVVATMSHRPERESFVNFTRIYLPTPLVIMTRDDDARIQSETDLNGLAAAMVEGYSSSARVMKDQPKARPLMVKTAREGLFAVATGKA
ncbi:MAG: transporter substrate-binding domain-containing protein, partial [Proteobacteria bacterium]|nr:transporter substrate-binding domain-containing protein [Pseudomonadota bacterium]